MSKVVVDEYSTTRATWDVVVSQLVQDATYPIADKVVASFMYYQDCYIFMKGIAVANGKSFKDSQDNLSFVTSNGHMEYKVILRDLYIGRREKP